MHSEREKTVFSRLGRLYGVGLPALLVLTTTVIASLLPNLSAQAVVSDTLNFQGRLLSNSGGLISDGSYNIEFNLYTVASGGTSQWTETRLNSGSQGVTVQNGYFSAYLGDVTAFPGTINWDQEQWLGMTVRGTGSCAFGVCTPTDAEMTPRFKLTAVPYAFRAGAVLDSAGNAYTGDDLVQVAPSTIQTLNTAIAVLRLNQTGTGGLIQLQGDGGDVFTVDKTGAATLGAGITVGNSLLTTAGTIRWSGTDLEVYDGTVWTSLTAGGLTPLAATFYDNTGGATVSAGVFSTINLDATLENTDPLLIVLAADTVTVQESGTYAISYDVTSTLASGTRSGFNAKLQLDTGGGFNDVSGSQAYHYGRITTETQGTSSARVVLTLSAGDILRVQGQGTTQSFTTVVGATRFTISKVGAGASGGSAGNSFVQNGNAFGSTAILGTTDIQGLNVIINGSNALTFTSAGAATFTNGLTLSSGGLALGGGDITASGNITGTAALTVASGGASDLTLDSASDVLILADATLRRSAAGTTTLDLLDAGAGTTFSITNSDGTQVAGLNVEGAVTAGSFSGSGLGITALDGSNVSSGTIADIRLSSNISLLDTAQTFTAVPTYNAGLILGNSTSTTAGATRWSGTDFEGFDGIQWVSLTAPTSAPLLEGVIAFGKYDGAGGTTLNADGATVAKNSTGNYTVTFDTVAADSNYTVQLTSLEPSATLDDIKINYDNATTSGFDVYVHEGDNGATADIPVDRTWDFIVFASDGQAGGGGGGGGTNFTQGGDAFAATAIFGTTDAFGISIITNNSLALSFTSGGNATFVKDVTVSGDLIIGAPPSPDVLAQTVIFTDVATNKGLVIQGTTSQSASLFELQDNNGNILSRFDEAGGLVLGRSTATSGTILFNNSTNSNTVTLTTNAVLGTRTIYLPDEDGTICLSGSSNCGFIEIGSGTIYTDASTNDSLAINKTTATGNLLLFQRSGSAVFTVANNGSLQIQATAATALDIRNAGGTSYLTVDTTTGTTTIDTLVLTNGISGAGLANCDTEYDVLQWSSGSGLFSCRDSSPQTIQVFDSAGGTDVNTATPLAIPFGSETQKTAGFTHDNLVNNNQITIDVAGWYRISYQINSDNVGNSRSTPRCRVRANGTTYILPSSSFSYLRNTTDDKGSNSATFLFQTTVTNEYIEVLCDQQGSTGVANTIPNESWLVVEKM